MAHEPVLMLVEDSPEDHAAMLRAFRAADLGWPVVHCWDGDEALDYLFHKQSYSTPDSSPRPSLVILDLNLPGSDGREVIKAMKEDRDLRLIPVVVFSSSSADDDVEDSYAAGASSYIRKPIDLGDLFQVVRGLLEYWCRLVLLPKISG